MRFRLCSINCEQEAFMNKHAYLRAYMAGIAVPTAVLLVVMTAYTVFRYVYNYPVPVERFIVFPMAVVPNAWGLWNVSCKRRDRKSTRLNSSHSQISYAVFCLKKKHM